MEKKILITGGMGFIGKHLTKKLLEEKNNKITIVDNLSSSKIDDDLIKNTNIVFYKESLENWEPDQKYDYVYHLASPVGPVGVLNYKGKIAEIIITHLYKMARYCIKTNAKLLFVSTSEVYGKHPENEKEGQKETLELVIPSNITVRLEYGVSKALAEIILKNLSRENPINYICIRPFNCVGPKQSGELGFVIPRFLKQALENKPITVYGDGSQKRTFTHVNDIVNAMILLMNSDIKNEVFNVGNPKNITTILDLAKKIKEAVNSKSEIQLTDPKQLFGKDFAEAWNKIPNIEKIKTMIGWEPEISLNEIIKEAAELKYNYF